MTVLIIVTAVSLLAFLIMCAGAFYGWFGNREDRKS